MKEKPYKKLVYQETFSSLTFSFLASYALELNNDFICFIKKVSIEIL